MSTTIKNYHQYSIKEEKKFEHELLLMVGVLLLRLNDVQHLTPQIIDQIIQIWKLEYWEEFNSFNKNNLTAIEKYVNKVLPNPQEHAIDTTLLPKLMVANTKMFQITIDYVSSKFKELAVLENDYNYDSEQSNEFLASVTNTVDNKINTFATQSTINNMKEFLTAGAVALAYTEYFWMTQRDNRVRPSHAAMDAKWFPLLDRSPKPAGFQPGEDWGCRCWMAGFR